MPFTPTPEQTAIVEAARSSPDNLLISALAGAAKTSTLILIAEALPQTSILCLAFNRKIADEMKTRLPANCISMTLNSLGHRTWANYLGRRLILDSSKTNRLLKSLIDNDLRENEKKVIYDYFADIQRAVGTLKANGYVPDDYAPPTGRPARQGLIGDDELDSAFDESVPDLVLQAVKIVYRRALDEAFDAKIDFDDQILLPTIWPAYFEQFPLVLVDEAQDLSPLNHATLQKVARKRLIAVGDSCQAIYGFRGADEDSMSNLQQAFNMKEFRLSISFRCPVEVVREAQWRAPHMRWPEWAKPGRILRPSSWSVDLVPDYAAILCRNNAPLFSLAIRFLKNGRFPELVGNDIGKYLIKVMRSFGDMSISSQAATAELAKWGAGKKAKAKNPDRIDDQIACIEVFLASGSTLGSAIAYAEHIMSASGPVKLLTGHKSKGLEFDHVFILDEFLLSKKGQDPNLRYVMQTRAKESLTYIDSATFEENVEADMYG